MPPTSEGAPGGEATKAKVRLRHGFGINTTVNGVLLHILQEWAGHAHLSTTAINADSFGKKEQNIAAIVWG
ncbi:hypothetical protein DKT77_18925 [Meridianimarinicoccus roseus]|uniref:Tyr recombinase domain-containing protein n=1 Tax=Meridianimarinicoccus roseus TaxID=2072018 RepID=A0A2V2L7C0_9RHOB|nr:hypothetical protein [Meridianimarinicoccus roseus]PWR01015.1 hypothetical protein DKT77_18925 [Meridianimarinicoccus roseus]